MSERFAKLRTSTLLLLTIGAVFTVAGIIVVVLANYTMKREAVVAAQKSAAAVLNRNLAVQDYLAQVLRPKLEALLKAHGVDADVDHTWMSSAFAVRRIERYLHRLDDKACRYKECAINARNPHDEANAYEKAFLQSLNSHHKPLPYSGIKVLHGQPYYVMLRPGEVMEPSCLHCHGAPGKAPASLLARYGSERGFHYKVGQMVSAASVRVPLAAAYAKADLFSMKLGALLLTVLGGLFGTLLWLNKRHIFTPLATIHKQVNRVAASSEHLGTAIPLPEGKELREITAAFNSMSASLQSHEERLEEEVRNLAAELRVARQQLEEEGSRCRQLEAALQENERRYREQTELLPQPVFEIDMKGAVTFANLSAFELFGYSREDFEKGLQALDMFIPEHREKVWKNIQRRLEGDPSSGNEYLSLRKDGSIFPSMLYSTRVVRDGQLVGLRGVLADVTPIKAAEEALERTNNYLINVLENSPDSTAMVDRHGLFTMGNKMVFTLFGYTADELKGRPAFNMYPDSVELARMLSKLRSEGSVQKYQIGMQRKDGSVFPAELSISLLKDSDGETIGSVAVCRDLSEIKRTLNELQEANTELRKEIAERRRAEEALRESEDIYRAIFEHTGTGMIIFEHDGTISLANSECERFTGYSTEDVEGRKTWMEFVAPEDVERIMEYQKLRRTQPDTVPQKYEFTLVDRLGNQKSAFVTVCVIPGLEKSVASVIDLTEQKKLQADLDRAQRMESLGVLAGGIAHDFNNILAAIIGYTELAQNLYADNTGIQGYLDQVLKASLRAKDLVRHILAFTRQSEGEYLPVQMSTIVKEVLKFLRASLPTTVRIKQNIKAQAGTVLADPTQIHQLLMNLCTNAAHAMREQGGELEVGLDAIHLNSDVSCRFLGLEPGSYVKLTVKDTGIGMSREISQRIFEPYFTTKDQGVGTGLGLAVVHGIVKNHGGTINVDSAVGRGSTFQVYLPAVACRVDGKQEQLAPIHPGRESILFVDDEKALVDLTRQALERLGYKVQTRTNGLDALKAFQAQPEAFDVIITDMTMPNMTGKELARELMEIRPDIPVILCTGFSEWITEEEARAIGIKDFLLKPIIIQDLAASIRKVLEKGRHDSAVNC